MPADFPPLSCDVLVIGGGINGTGIAADAAGRGLKVVLAEAGDLGGATSSASSKLIHGGLRYLEQYAFRLVREALGERETMMRRAPHLIWPLRFILPQSAKARPWPIVRAGLFLYDHLAPRHRLGTSGCLDLRRDAAARPLRSNIERAFTYWDCWVDDSRLVIANALEAERCGAVVLTRHAVASLADHDGRWLARASSGAGCREILARAVVNAAGPWVEQVADLGGGSSLDARRPAPRLRLIKGSHIVVPRIAGADDGYLLQNDDGRVVFVLPFADRFSLIGTTDTPIGGDPAAITVTAGEARYLLDAANSYLARPLSEADVVWQFAGVRPLDDDGQDNPSEVSRDYRLMLSNGPVPPMLHVIGGKITTYRRLAERALEALAPLFPGMGPAWTRGAPLPGGEIANGDFETWLTDTLRRYPQLPGDLVRALARRHGTRIDALLEGVQSLEDFGPELAPGLHLKELSYFKHKEWAMTADDVLWRRTKAGLHVPPADRAAVTGAVDRALAAL